MQSHLTTSFWEFYIIAQFKLQVCFTVEFYVMIKDLKQTETSLNHLSRWRILAAFIVLAGAFKYKVLLCLFSNKLLKYCQ